MSNYNSKEHWGIINRLKNELMDKYPLLYADRHESMQRTAMCWGLEVGQGWLPLIDELSAKLEKVIEKFIQDNPNLPCAQCVELKDNHKNEDHVYQSSHPRASQVKEKYGTLRFYISGCTDEIDALISDAERRSAKICEECNSPGQQYGGGWVTTLCEECAKSRGIDTQTSIDF